MTGKPRSPGAAGSPWRVTAVCAAVAVGATGVLGAWRAGVPWWVGAFGGGAAAALGVLALPSIPTRRASIAVVALGGAAAARHAAIPGVDSVLLGVWAVATLVALVSVDRAQAEETRPLTGASPLPSRTLEVGRASVAVGAIVLVAAVALVPALADSIAADAASGETPGEGDIANAPNTLRAGWRLDMTSRPRLGDQVVFTVDAARADFWRGETYDQWDGSSWTRSDVEVRALERRENRVTVQTDPFDDGARDGAPMRQRFRIEAGYAEVIFAAPSAVELYTEEVVMGRPDGTLVSPTGLGRGATYTVVSRSALPTEQTLRAANTGVVPREVLDRYAAVPLASGRAAVLAARITEDAPTTYDKIRAIEAWLGDNTQYSLDAPLAPVGVDVVDHFLFESRLGWCEQVASSLVVLARSVGIPARLAVGFVPGEHDRLTGRFVVRERDAHAWAEVYFPGIGWQPFDPTASVPLAGEAPNAGSWLDMARDRAPQLGAFGLLAAAAGFAAAPLRRVVRARRRPATWGGAAMRRLERLGTMAGRPRAPAETPARYAAAVAARLGAPELVSVGEAIDADAFSRAGMSAEVRARADAVLAGGRRYVRTS